MTKITEHVQLREGDTVSVRAVVRFAVEDGENRVHVTLNGYAHCAVKPEDVLNLLGRDWQVGERVRNEDDLEEVGEVRGVVDGEWVVVRLDRGPTILLHSMSLMPLEPPPKVYVASAAAVTVDGESL